MAQRRFSGNGFRAPRPKRATTWLDTFLDTSLADAGQFTTGLMFSFDQDEAVGMTLTRLLLCLQLSALVGNTIDSQQIIDIGIGTASAEAFAAVVLPDPNQATEFPEKGWIYRCRHLVNGDAANQLLPVRIELDLKSQRKIDTGVVWLSMQSITNGGTVVATIITGSVRLLMKLP